MSIRILFMSPIIFAYILVIGIAALIGGQAEEGQDRVGNVVQQGLHSTEVSFKLGNELTWLANQVARSTSRRENISPATVSAQDELMSPKIKTLITHAMSDEIRQNAEQLKVSYDNWLVSLTTSLGVAWVPNTDIFRNYAVLNAQAVSLNELIVETTHVKIRKVQARVSGMIMLEMGLLLVGGVLVLYAAFWFAKKITNPIVDVIAAMNELAHGNSDVVLPEIGMVQEADDMIDALQVFKENSLERARLRAEFGLSNAERTKRALETRKLVDHLRKLLPETARGIFKSRIDNDLADEDLREVVDGVNDLVDTVDRGITETGKVLSALAEADLSQRVTGEYHGAFHKLKDDTNAVAEKLTGIVVRLTNSSQQLRTATGEILSGSNDLSVRTTTQATTIEETSTAMEQLAKTVMQNAHQAETASENSDRVYATAEESGAVMSEANEAMDQISRSSVKISNVIGLIDDIAFQTNLLALNASVEAARAGDAGKGFAVVAIEVRRLAQSAAQASSEVKILIEQSANEVTSGSVLVQNASKKLQGMLDEIRLNNKLMKGIADDCRHQASAIGLVSKSVQQMDELTQHNAALVDETNAAIGQTEKQVNELDRIVAVFTTGEHTGYQMPAHGHANMRPPAMSYASHGNAAVSIDWDEM